MKKIRSFLSWLVVLSLALGLLPLSVARAQAVTVTVDAPATVPQGGEFVARINISRVTDLNVSQLDVTYDPAVIRVKGDQGGAEGVTPGLIDSTVVPVMWAFIPSGVQGRIRVLGDLPGVAAVTGSGFLAELHFLVVGTAGQCSPITLVPNTVHLFNNLAQEITPVTLVDDEVCVVGPASVSISGTKIDDLDGDGAIDPGEPGIAGATIYLDLNNNGALDPGEPSTTTAANGSYSFAGLVAGTYVVRQVTPAGYTSTNAIPGPGGTKVNNDTISVAAATPGQSYPDQDFLDWRPVSISGTKYDDLDGDGAIDPGEPGIAGATIYLDLNNNGAQDGGEPSTTTNGNGDYSFTNLQAGTYVVRQVTPAGYTSTNAIPGPGGTKVNNDTISVAATTPGGSYPDQDFLDHILAALEITKTDYLLTDADGNGAASPEDTILYRFVITNVGTTPAIDVTFTDTPDPNTKLVAGSVTTTRGSVTEGNTPGDTSVAVHIGTIQGGKKVEITFEVTINSPLPPSVTKIANQSLTSGANIKGEPSDDSETPQDDDATITPIAQPWPAVPGFTLWGTLALALLLPTFMARLIHIRSMGRRET